MHSQSAHHSYSGSREEVGRLIEWLLDRRYWLEAEYHVDDFLVRCGVGPATLKRAGFRTVEPG